MIYVYSTAFGYMTFFFLEERFKIKQKGLPKKTHDYSKRLRTLKYCCKFWHDLPI